MRRIRMWTGAVAAAGALVAWLATSERGGARTVTAAATGARPDVVLITVDTLRADRLSSYGYRRPTSPILDRLLREGVRFAQARTVEPLTGPAMASLLTSLHPHQHGATRNGLRVLRGLDSLPRQLRAHGWRSVALVGNWTLRDELCGLGEHFDGYRSVLTRKRWYGLFKGEAPAAEINALALRWLASAARDPRPFFLWVHYVEPHAPYRLHLEEARRLRLAARHGAGASARSDRYDTEVAHVDREIGHLLAALDALPNRPEPLIVFAADHGEALGEHGVWGHGRTLHEATLRVPLGLRWRGVVAPRVVAAPALLLDVAPTVAGLLGLAAPASFGGFDWTPVLRGAAPEPHARVAGFQAHRGAVLDAAEARRARRGGLLEIGVLAGGRKEVIRVGERGRFVFDLEGDPHERRSLVPSGTRPSAALARWLSEVERGLARAEAAPPPRLDAEAVETLQALGYTD